MKALAEALVHTVTYLSIVTREHKDKERRWADGEALAEVTEILEKATDPELDALADAARRALAAERRRKKQDPKRIAYLQNWMEDNVDGECLARDARWSGNDRMDDVDRAICCYLSETSDRAGHIDSLCLLHSDPRIVDLLLTIVGDPEEDHLARIGALRHFQYFTPPDPAGQDRLVKACLDILTGNGAGVPVRGPVNDPGLVRQYAVFALVGYADRPEVEKVLLALLTDQKGDLRSAAFQTLSSSARRDANEPLFRQLLNDDSLRKEIETYFRMREQRRKG